MKRIGMVLATVVLACGMCTTSRAAERNLDPDDVQALVEAVVSELEARGFKPATEFKLCRKIDANGTERCNRKRLKAVPVSE